MGKKQSELKWMVERQEGSELRAQASPLDEERQENDAWLGRAHAACRHKLSSALFPPQLAHVNGQATVKGIVMSSSYPFAQLHRKDVKSLQRPSAQHDRPSCFISTLLCFPHFPTSPPRPYPVPPPPPPATRAIPPFLLLRSTAMQSSTPSSLAKARRPGLEPRKGTPLPSPRALRPRSRESAAFSSPPRRP